MKTIPSMTDCVIGGDPWDPDAKLYDARHCARATAVGNFAADWGIDFGEVECTTRYARWLSPREQWHSGPSDRWADEWVDEHDPPLHLDADLKWCLPNGTICEPPEPPDDPPEGWEPREEDPAWTFCDRDHAGAVKVYVCASKA